MLVLHTERKLVIKVFAFRIVVPNVFLECEMSEGILSVFYVCVEREMPAPVQVAFSILS